MTRTPRQRRRRKTKTVMSSKDIRWEVVFVAETEDVERKALDDVMGILYDFGVRKGLFANTELNPAEPEQHEGPRCILPKHSYLLPISPCLAKKS